MVSCPQGQSWIPTSGTRLPEGVHSKLLYPFLEVTRFLHLSGTSTPDPGNQSLEEDFFSDDDEFERDAAEWFDKQEASAFAPQAPPQAMLNNEMESFENNGEGKDENAGEEQEVLPPLTSLDYIISNDLFQAARKSKPETPGSFWSHTMYSRTQEDGTEQKVKVHYCTSKHTMENVCTKYFLGEKILGFDMEWFAYADRNSGVRKNVSLIQLASPGHVGLFHIALFLKDDFVAPTFRAIMEDPGVSKAGVNISGDRTRLRNYLGVQSQGIFELSHLYKLVKHSKDGRLDLINRKLVPMATQMRDVLHLPIYKGQSVRSSNWALPLNKQQIAYSASDAYAGLQLYHVLEEERVKLDPCPPRPYHAEKCLPIRVARIIDSEEELESTDKVSTEQDVPILKPRKPIQSKIPEPPAKDRDARVLAVEEKIKSSRPSLSVQSSRLRSYYIWYDNENLTPEDIAKLLRDPPLKTNTVVSYILDAVTIGQLPYDKTRLKEEVLINLAPNVLESGKYKALADDVKDS